METETKEFDSKIASETSFTNSLSYSLGGFLDNFFSAAFTVRVISYYEDEILLPIILVSLSFVIYGLWNMFNDPLIGFFTDRNTKITRRWGRRFPWYMIAVIPFIIFYLLIFTVPFYSTVLIFLWLLFCICMFDFFYSLWDTSWLALFPEKFRSNKERTNVAGIVTICGQVGIALGMLIPPIFIIYGNRTSFIISAFVVVIIGIIVAILIIPGMLESKKIKEQNKGLIKKKDKGDSFFNNLKFALKQKNFLVYIFVYLSQMVLWMLVLGSLYYWVRYVLKMDAEVEIYISAAFLLGSVISVPFWVFMGLRLGNRRVYIIGSFLTAICFLPFLFISELIYTIIAAALLGFSIGALFTLMYPTFSDVIDEIVLKTGKRNEGMYTGIRTFFGRTSNIIGAIVFAVVHTFTAYQPGASYQTPLALWGIRIIMVLIPMIFYLISFLLVWKIYDLTPEKVRHNQSELKVIKL